MKNIKIAYFGTPVFSAYILEELLKEYPVGLIVTQEDKLVGRHQIITSSPVKKLALKHHIPVFTPAKIRLDYQTIVNYQPDIIITCAYGQIIPKEILDLPALGCINVHASLLPKLRGGAPIHHAIIDGYKETGITIMYMDEKMDNGDIISQDALMINACDNTGIIHDKLMVLGAKLLLETLPKIISGTNERLKQNEGEVTFGYNIKREEEIVDFNKSTRDVYNQIRGLYPWPLAYITLDNQEIKVLESRLSEAKPQGKLGEITNVYKDGLGIKTLDGEIIITKIKPSGKNEMGISEYLNSHKSMMGKVVNE